MFRETKRLSPERGERRRFIRRLEIHIAAKQHGIAPPFETGKVVQRHTGFLPHFNAAAILPVPVGAFGSERRGQRFAVYQQLKPPGRSLCFPRGNPIASAHPHPHLAHGWEFGSGLCIGDWFTQSVSQEIWRAHLIHELLIHHPSAEFFKLLGFKKNIRAIIPRGWGGDGSKCGSRGGQEQCERKAERFHCKVGRGRENIQRRFRGRGLVCQTEVGLVRGRYNVNRSDRSVGFDRSV